MNELLQEVTPLIVNVLLALLGLVCAVVINTANKYTARLREETAQIQDERKRELLYDALDQLDSLTTVTVGSLQATAAKTVRTAIAQGTMTREDLVALGEAARDEIVEKLQPKCRETIDQVVGDIYEYTMGLIEVKLEQVKAEEAATKNSGLVPIAVPVELLEPVPPKVQ